MFKQNKKNNRQLQLDKVKKTNENFGRFNAQMTPRKNQRSVGGPFSPRVFRQSRITDFSTNKKGRSFYINARRLFYNFR